MRHNSSVRRSFNPKENTTANLSEETLSLFNNADPDAPFEEGQVDLAPNYADFLIYGNYGVRLKVTHNSYYWNEDDITDNA